MPPLQNVNNPYQRCILADGRCAHWTTSNRAEIDAWVASLLTIVLAAGKAWLKCGMCMSFAELAQCWRDALVVCHVGTIRLLLAVGTVAAHTIYLLAAAQRTDTVACGELVVVNC